MRQRRRRVHVPPDLTSLFDVLFIVIFAALIRAAAAQQQASAAEAAAAPAPPAPPPPALTPDALHARALAQLGSELAARPAVVVRVRADGHVVALEASGKTIAMDAPLLEHVPDPDVAVGYLGDRAADLRLCRLVASHLQVAELSGYLVIVAPDRALADLPHALFDGLHRDVDRCMAEQRVIAALVAPEDRLVRDVAKLVERRARRRKLLLVGALAALVVLALMYLHFGAGWGLGGSGAAVGGGSGSGSAAPAGPRRCAVRVTGAGITVDGKPATRVAAVAACRDTTGADVVVTGDARQGDWDDLHAALDAAHVPVSVRR